MPSRATKKPDFRRVAIRESGSQRRNALVRCYKREELQRDFLDDLSLGSSLPIT
jgi:hypothetical protein